MIVRLPLHSVQEPDLPPSLLQYPAVETIMPDI
jgi:hypothetical protein